MANEENHLGLLPLPAYGCSQKTRAGSCTLYSPPRPFVQRKLNVCNHCTAPDQLKSTTADGLQGALPCLPALCAGRLQPPRFLKRTSILPIKIFTTHATVVNACSLQKRGTGHIELFPGLNKKAWRELPVQNSVLMFILHQIGVSAVAWGKVFGGRFVKRIQISSQNSMMHRLMSLFFG